MSQSIQDLVDAARLHEVKARRAEIEARRSGLNPGSRYQAWKPHADAAFNAAAVALNAEQDALDEWNRTKKSQ